MFLFCIVFYILKIKGTKIIPDFIQIRDEKMTLRAYFRVSQIERGLEKNNLKQYTKELTKIIEKLPLEKFINTFQRMDKPIILLEGVNIHQDERLIFDNINLSISKGDFIYLVGETGSGKSSLVKSFYAEVSVSAGNIFVAGYNLNKLNKNEIPSLRRDLGIVFQDFQLLSDRTINENLEFVLKATGWKNKEEILK